MKKYLFRNSYLFEDKEPGAPAVWRQTSSPECVLTYPCLGHVWNYSKHFNLSILLAALYAGPELHSTVRFQSCILGSWSRPRDGLLLTVLMTEQLWHQKSSSSLSYVGISHHPPSFLLIFSHLRRASIVKAALYSFSFPIPLLEQSSEREREREEELGI